MASTWLLTAPTSAVFAASYYVTRLPGISYFLEAPEVAHRVAYAAHRALRSEDRSLRGVSTHLGQDAAGFGAGLVLQGLTTQVGLAGTAAPIAKSIKCLAAGVRWLDQWTRVQAAAQVVSCILKGVPTLNEMRKASLQHSPVIVREQDCLNDILPALSKLMAELAGSLYYADRASRAFSEPGDTSRFVVNDLMDTVRVFGENPALAEKAERVWNQVQVYSGVSTAFVSIKESVQRSGTAMRAWLEATSNQPAHVASS